MIGPHYNSRSTKVAVVVKGSGWSQMATLDKSREEGVEENMVRKRKNVKKAKRANTPSIPSSRPTESSSFQPAFHR